MLEQGGPVSKGTMPSVPRTLTSATPGTFQGSETGETGQQQSGCPRLGHEVTCILREDEICVELQVLRRLQAAWAGRWASFFLGAGNDLRDTIGGCIHLVDTIDVSTRYAETSVAAPAKRSNIEIAIRADVIAEGKLESLL